MRRILKWESILGFELKSGDTWSEELTGGVWRTVHGSHVFVRGDGSIADGPPHLVGRHVSDVSEHEWGQRPADSSGRREDSHEEGLTLHFDGGSGPERERVQSAVARFPKGAIPTDIRVKFLDKLPPGDVGEEIGGLYDVHTRTLNLLSKYLVGVSNPDAVGCPYLEDSPSRENRPPMHVGSLGASVSGGDAYIIHELAHAWDIVSEGKGQFSGNHHGYGSDGQETPFGHAWAVALDHYQLGEKDSFPSRYARQNAHEGFSETVSAYLLNPERLKKACPTLYGAVDRIFHLTRVGSPESRMGCSAPEVKAGDTWSEELTGGGWKTIHGQHVYIQDDGTIHEGPPHLVGKNIKHLTHEDFNVHSYRDHSRIAADNWGGKGPFVGSDRGEPYIGVPAGVVPDGEEAFRMKHEPNQLSGSQIRGKGMRWDDHRIPDTVYHVTTNLPAVVKSGYLRAGGVGGLGGDNNDRIVSTTIDPNIANQLASDIKLSINVAKIPRVKPYYDEDSKKWVAPGGEEFMDKVLKLLDEDAAKYGFKWDHGGADDNPSLRSHYAASSGHDWLTRYFTSRDMKGGVLNPLMLTDDETLRSLDPDKVGIVKIPKQNLNTGAQITNFDLDKRKGSSLQEARIYGDLPIGPQEQEEKTTSDEPPILDVIYLSSEGREAQAVDKRADAGVKSAHVDTWSEELTGGRWITLAGAIHVYIKGDSGDILQGPSNWVGKNIRDLNDSDFVQETKPGKGADGVERLTQAELQSRSPHSDLHEISQGWKTVRQSVDRDAGASETIYHNNATGFGIRHLQTRYGRGRTAHDFHSWQVYGPAGHMLAIHRNAGPGVGKLGEVGVATHDDTHRVMGWADDHAGSMQSSRPAGSDRPVSAPAKSPTTKEPLSPEALSTPSATEDASGEYSFPRNGTAANVEDWGRKVWGDWWDGLDRMERYSITEYVKGSAQRLNSFLRHGPNRNRNDWDIANEKRSQTAEANRLHGALAKAKLPEDMTLHRLVFTRSGKDVKPGTGISISDFKVGKEFSDKGFVSTSPSARWLSTALDYTGKHGNWVGGPSSDVFTMTIKVPKGAPAAFMNMCIPRDKAPVEDKSIYSAAEILLQNGSRFRVTGVDAKARNVSLEWVGVDSADKKMQSIGSDNDKEHEWLARFVWEPGDLVLSNLFASEDGSIANDQNSSDQKRRSLVSAIKFHSDHSGAESVKEHFQAGLNRADAKEPPSALDPKRPLRMRSYDPNEARDAHGRWTSAGDNIVDYHRRRIRRSLNGESVPDEDIERAAENHAARDITDDFKDAQEVHDFLGDMGNRDVVGYTSRGHEYGTDDLRKAASIRWPDSDSKSEEDQSSNRDDSDRMRASFEPSPEELEESRNKHGHSADHLHYLQENARASAFRSIADRMPDPTPDQPEYRALVARGACRGLTGGDRNPEYDKAIESWEKDPENNRIRYILGFGMIPFKNDQGKEDFREVTDNEKKAALDQFYQRANPTLLREGKAKLVESVSGSWQGFPTGNPHAQAFMLAVKQHLAPNAATEHFTNMEDYHTYDNSPLYEGTHTVAQKQSWLHDIAKAVYANTQDELKKRHIKSIRVYRGVKTTNPALKPAFSEVPDSGEHGAEVSYREQPLNSYTTDPGMAVVYGGGGDKGTGTAVATQVPAKNVFAWFRTGFGHIGEHEVVTLGGRRRVRAVATQYPDEDDIRSGIESRVGRPEMERRYKHDVKLLQSVDVPNGEAKIAAAISLIDSDPRNTGWLRRPSNLEDTSEEKAYNPDEPRNRSGEWTSGDTEDQNRDSSHSFEKTDLYRSFSHDPEAYQHEYVQAKGDHVLNRIAKEMGRDGTPEVVSEQELRRHISDGDRELWRGETSPEIAESFRSGPYRAGAAVTGSGISSAYGDIGRRTAFRYAGDKGEVHHMALRRDAKVITMRDAVRQAEAEHDAIQKMWPEVLDHARATGDWSEANRLNNLQNITHSLGRWAMSKGYDAVDQEDMKWLVLLNRGAVRVAKYG